MEQMEKNNEKEKQQKHAEAKEKCTHTSWYNTPPMRFVRQGNNKQVPKKKARKTTRNDSWHFDWFLCRWMDEQERKKNLPVMTQFIQTFIVHHLTQEASYGRLW